MGLSTALNTSLSGLRVSQSQMDIISTNIANVDSVGYTRRRLNVVQQLTSSTTTGVRVDGVTRQLQAQVQKQVRLETAGAAYTAVRADYAEQLDQMFGTPGQAGSLDSTVNEFAKSLQALTTSPSDYSARTQVLSSAQNLASQLNGLTEEVQRMRTGAEAEIAAGVERVNSLLEQISSIDGRLFFSGSATQNSPGLLDERDRAIDELASLIDVRAVSDDNGKLTLFTSGGLQIYGASAIRLTFDARGDLSANNLYTNSPTQRGVGTIRIGAGMGPGIDAIAAGVFKSGSLAAHLEMRDKVLVEAQTQLDDLAASLASVLGDRNPTAPVVVGANQGFDTRLEDLVTPGTLAMKAGNALTIEVGTPTGTRRYQFIATDGAAPTPLPAGEGEGGATVVRFDRSAGFAGLQSLVQSTLGSGFTASIVTIPAQAGPPPVAAVPNVLRVLDAGGGNSVSSVRAAFSVSGLTGEGPELPLFTDVGGNAIYTGTLDGARPQKLGFAGRIGVNPSLLTDNSRLVVYNTTPGATTQPGDSTRPKLLLDRLSNATRGLSAGAGIGDSVNGYRSTVTDIARRIVEDQGANASRALSLDQGQQIVLKTVQAKYAETSGVSIDQEMSDLVQIQNAYAANARVMSAVKDLFDMMMRIGA